VRAAAMNLRLLIGGSAIFPLLSKGIPD